MALGVLGGILATVLGGLFFACLRLRSGSICGPALTHWLVNALGALAAFLEARQQFSHCLAYEKAPMLSGQASFG